MIVLLLLVLAMTSCRTSPLPIVGPICHGAPSRERSCDCWYFCGANWHPTADDLRRFGGTPQPTITTQTGRALHWRDCS